MYSPTWSSEIGERIREEPTEVANPRVFPVALSLNSKEELKQPDSS